MGKEKTKKKDKSESVAEEKEMTLEEVLDAYSYLEHEYVDVDFIPESTNIGTLVGLPTYFESDKPEGLVNIRPYNPPIDPGDIYAKSFLSADSPIIPGRMFAPVHSPLPALLSIIQRDEFVLKSLFANHKPNPAGAYRVSLAADGVRQDVLVDGVFPCELKTRKTLGVRCKNVHDAWASVVEKALAKLEGFYAAVHVMPLPALAEALFASPVLSTNFSSPEAAVEFADALKKVRDNRHVHALVSPHGTDNTDCVFEIDGFAEFDGSIFVHVSSAMGVEKGSDAELRIAMLLSASKRDDMLVRMGSSLDKYLFPYVAEQKKKEQESEYIFPERMGAWFTQELLFSEFEWIHVIHSDSSWRTHTTRLTLTTLQNVFTFTLAEPGDVFLSVRQELPQNSQSSSSSKRKSGMPQATPLGIRLCIVGGERPYIPYGGTHESFVITTTTRTDRIKLPAGTFFAMAEIYKPHAERLPMPAVASIYVTSPSGTSLRAVQFSEGAGPEWSFVLPEFAQRNGICSCCKQPLAGAIFQLNKEMRYHQYCFVCSVCHKPLGKQLFIKDESLLCENCSNK